MLVQNDKDEVMYSRRFDSLTWMTPSSYKKTMKKHMISHCIIGHCLWGQRSRLGPVKVKTVMQTMINVMLCHSHIVQLICNA